MTQLGPLQSTMAAMFRKLGAPIKTAVYVLPNFCSTLILKFAAVVTLILNETFAVPQR